jgi:hypothetical protein
LRDRLMSRGPTVMSSLARSLTVCAGLLVCLVGFARAEWLLVPMDGTQADHLRAYGLTYWVLQEPREYRAEWLLNYRAGSFLLEDHGDVRSKALGLGVNFLPVSADDVRAIKNIIADENMDTVILEKAPKVAVYAPPDDTPMRDPWDDAVKMALEYAEIPYDTVWDEQLLDGTLDRDEYDWLHLHHEDFTGQHGKFYGAYRNASWYQQRVRLFEEEAVRLGYASVPRVKGAVAQAVQSYIARGGFVFAMCSAPETLDIALAARGGAVDIVERELDRTAIDPDYATKLDFDRTLAFTGFTLQPDPIVYEFSNIDNPTPDMSPDAGTEDFTLFRFSAKYDPIQTMLTQCHVAEVHGFLGQTTSFRRSLLRNSVVVLGDIRGSAYAKYVHAKLQKGTFTYLAGHDPEDYRHTVGERATQLELHKNSPGYRLILNNVLFPAAKERPHKT